MAVGILNLHITLSFCKSLKDKRSIIKPVIYRLHEEFNLSVAEMAYQDSLKECVISCAAISEDNILLQRTFSYVIQYFEHQFPDLVMLEHTTEYF
jgi:uncharacterized protein YlxP (DUF503 family)